MLESKLDHIVVGKNFLSYFLALKLERENNSTLLLNDKRVSFGEFSVGEVTELDKRMLISLGKKYNIKSFINIDDFLNENIYSIVLNGLEIKLGATPFQNLTEFLRKFYAGDKAKKAHQLYSKFSDEQSRADFNSKIFNSIDKIIENTLELSDLKSLNLSLLQGCSDKLFVEFFDIFVTETQDYSFKDSLKDKELLYTLQVLFRHAVVLNLSKVEIFYLFISMLSPSYKVDRATLGSALKSELIDASGKVRDVELSSWQFSNSSPWAVELSCFEGVVMPKELSFVGTVQGSLPLYIPVEESFFNIISADISFNSSDAIFTQSSNKYFINSSNIGDILTLWKVNNISEENINISILVQNQKGSKVEFYKDEVRSFILKNLNTFYSLPEVAINDISLSMGRDTFLSDEFEKPLFKEVAEQELTLYDSSDLVNPMPITNVSYYGPKKKYPFGLFSILLSMNQKKISQRGQAAIEYILMTAVIATLMFTIMTSLKGFLIADAGECTESSESLVCNFEKFITLDGFRHFIIFR